LPSREIRRAQQKMDLDKKRAQAKKKSPGKKKGGPKKKRITIKQFMTEVQAEMKKVTWPTRQEATSYTVIVLVVVTLVGTFIWAADQFFGYLVRVLIIR
jgi:preprotein translocase subunit SecE